MQTKTALIAAFVLPLLFVACDRADQSPTAAVPGQEKQAESPDKTLERSPPAAGMPGTSTGSAAGDPATAPQPATPTPDNASPATRQEEMKKAY